MKIFRKTIVSSILLLLAASGAWSSQAPGQRICLNMIVKNETEVIERCLESTLPLIDYWVIVDTGSEDGTQDLIRNYMKKQGIPGELHERPWVNFCHNRSEALELARGKGDYILFIDADEIFQYDDDFSLPKLTKDFYYIELSYSGLRYARTSLVKNALNWEWRGILHEVICSDQATSFETLPHIKNCVDKLGGARSKDLYTYEKDSNLLKEAHEKEPNNSRTVFYLAQSYFDSKQYPLALSYYQKRISMGGFNEEVYWSYLRMGETMELLKYPLEKVIAQYQQAYNYRPSRFEALYLMAKNYRLAADYSKGYQLCQIAKALPPNDDRLFVCQWMADYGIALEESICAYWVGNLQECLDLSSKLLKRSDLPDNVRECVQRNLAITSVQLVGQICSLENSETDISPCSKLLLVTGCARSGTGYISNLLTECGVEIGHEEWGAAGCSSWPMAVKDTFVPWGVNESGMSFHHVLHQVRNPLEVIRSVFSSEPKESWDFICKHIPEISQDDPLMVKCAKYWYYWNLKAGQRAEFTYRLENIEEAFDKISEILSVDLNKEKIGKISKKINSRSHSLEFTWKDLEAVLPQELLNNIRNLARSYGYSESELGG